MKKQLIYLIFSTCISGSYGQLGVNATGAAPIASAQLDVASTSKAFYPPRMTNAQKNAIVGPQAGAVVFDTNLGALSYYNGGAWISTAPTVSGATYSIGQLAQGGKVFWLDGTGQHGLVMAPADAVFTTVWSNGFTITNALRNGAYGGASNTELILQSLGNGETAALSASFTTAGNYGDWYLPSIGELILMRNSGVSGITTGVYWSSTESFVQNGLIPQNASTLNFSSGAQLSENKLIFNKVRAVRKF